MTTDAVPRYKSWNVDRRTAVRKYNSIVKSSQAAFNLGTASRFSATWCFTDVMFFYRTMLCIARTMPSQDVFPSICPSVTRRYSIKQLKLSSNFFHWRVATPFWFFRTKRCGNTPTESPKERYESTRY